MKALLALATLTTLATSASAKDSLPSEVKSLQRMVGVWNAKGASVNLGGKAMKVDVTMSCTAASGGSAVVCLTKIAGPGLLIEETDLFGYDPQEKRYHWYAVTSTGESHDHVALPPTGNERAWLFVHSGSMDSKPMQEIVRLTFDATGKRLELKNHGVVDGQTAWQVTALLSKP